MNSGSPAGGCNGSIFKMPDKKRKKKKAAKSKWTENPTDIAIKNGICFICRTYPAVSGGRCQLCFECYENNRRHFHNRTCDGDNCTAKGTKYIFDKRAPKGQQPLLKCCDHCWQKIDETNWFDDDFEFVADYFKLRVGPNFQ